MVDVFWRWWGLDLKNKPKKEVSQMHKWTKWLTTVAVLSLVMVVSLLAGCAPSKPAAAPAPAPAPAPQPTVQPPTPAPPAAKGTADLVIKDLWQEQSQVYYKVANLGNGD
jgi:hypothetical protein